MFISLHESLTLRSLCFQLCMTDKALAWLYSAFRIVSNFTLLLFFLSRYPNRIAPMQQIWGTSQQYWDGSRNDLRLP